MIDFDFPTSKDADICLILEGTYPFVGGGVSHWVNELIKVFSQYRFAIIFLGTKEADYSKLHYSLPKNVVHLEAHFLFESSQIVEHTQQDIPPELMKTVKSMHDQLTTFMSDKSNSIPELFVLMDEHCPVKESHFLRSKSSWQLLVNKYTKHYSDQSFFDYFWGIRNLHRPFWTLAKIVNYIPDVKILHSASTGYAGFLGALLQKKYGLPYILTEHGIYTKERWIELMRHYFFESVTQEGSQLDNQKGLFTVWTRFFSILAKIGYCSANPIISLIEEYRQRQIEDGASPDRTKIISYGIDFNRYKFLDKPKPNLSKPVVAFVGRVVPIKDVKTFIRACALIIKKIPSAEAWIIGPVDEDPDYASTCKNLVIMLGLKDKIKFLGMQNVMDIYPKIDLLLLSSISEGSPFVILESFAVGIPVVTTNVGGCQELIEGKNADDKLLGAAGKLVSIADPDSLSDAAVELITNEVAWRSAQRAGIARVRKYYSMEQLRENYDLIYKEAILYGRNRI